jgi:hypothetical protein
MPETAVDCVVSDTEVGHLGAHDVARQYGIYRIHAGVHVGASRGRVIGHARPVVGRYRDVVFDRSRLVMMRPRLGPVACML